MKKTILTVCLSIYLTLATVGCAVFAYLYFSTRFGSEELTYASAKNLVNTACYDLGLISKEEYQSSIKSKNEVSSTSIEFKDDDSTTIENETLEMLGVNYYLNKGMLSFKYALDEDIEENVYYNSASADQSQKVIFKFNLNKNQAIFQFYPNENTSLGYNDGQEIYVGEKIVIQKESDGWKIGYKVAVPTSGAYDFYDIKIEADENGVFKVDANVVGFNINVVGYDGPDFTKYTSIDNSILASMIFSQNTKTKERLFASSTPVSWASDVQTLSEKEHLDLINDTINSMKDVEIKNYEKDIKNLTLKNVDFYQKVLDKLK